MPVLTDNALGVSIGTAMIPEKFHKYFETMVRLMQDPGTDAEKLQRVESFLKDVMAVYSQKPSDEEDKETRKNIIDFVKYYSKKECRHKNT